FFLEGNMKIKLPRIHNQILIALILGAIFGAFFNVNKFSLVFSVKDEADSKTILVNNWKSIAFIINKTDIVDTVEFASDSQLEIISFAAQLKKDNSEYFCQVINPNGSLTEIKNINSVDREKSIAEYIKWIGDIFIRLLNMIAIPLVLASLIVGAASLGDIKKFARIGGKTLAFYLTTTAIAITIGLVAANLIKPGERMGAESKARLMSAYSGESAKRIGTATDYNPLNELVNLVPKNPFSAIATSEMLQIVFFAVMVGLVLGTLKDGKAEPVIKFFDGLSSAMIKMVELIMLMAPLGVFALIAATVSQFGFDILQTLIWYSLTVVLGLSIHTLVSYPLLLKSFSKMKVSFFFKGIRPAQVIGFTTSSSAATLPVNMECCQDNLGVPKSITSFVLPLGATINMDGTALYQGVAAVFIAQVFGIELNMMQQLTIVLTATLASIGTAPVPGVGLIMLVIILRAVGIPEEGVALILGVDRILDMCRTITNITGDATAAVIVANSEKVLVT
ncbi:MAG: dicarboxylate/amino acid:cation symporter, partial [Ignavibacteriaceae bacterium]|nr:dicarboxylate/amino acid:cation symporter [Ignavibacteriaceae bacterium]